MKSGTERPTATEGGALPKLLGRAGFRVIDLSMVLKDDPSPFLKVKVTNLGHDIGAQDHQKYLGVDPQDWPNPGNSCGDDFLETTTHAGTHMDAPIHFGPWTIPDHKEPRRIDTWPLEWCMGDGVVLDIRDIPQAHEVSAAEVQERLDRIGYQLKPFDIVLVMTGNDKFWGTPEYLDRGGHLGREALQFILEQGVKVVGTDSWSFDRPWEAVGGRLPGSWKRPQISVAMPRPWPGNGIRAHGEDDESRPAACAWVHRDRPADQGVSGIRRVHPSCSSRA